MLPLVMLNLLWSAPPTIEKVTACGGKSASVAVEFTTRRRAFRDCGGRGEVNTGLLSLIGVTVTQIACSVVRLPSLACTITT